MPAQNCRWDCISLGEVMLRLDPGEGRIHTARQFTAWEGGGEYNVVRGLRRCFGLRAAVMTALADNPVGRLIEDLILHGGVDSSLIHWKPFDGIGRSNRNGLNFTERGFGVRGGVGSYDRGHTAIGGCSAGDFDFEETFGKHGARWFHTGGIFAGLSEMTPEVALEAIRAAKRHGVVVSYDLNYRESLWRDVGGKERAQEVHRALVAEADVLFGNQEAFSAMLGVEGETAVDGLRNVARAYPNLELVASTQRNGRSTSRCQWGAALASGGKVFVEPMREVEILDRVGSGDSFAAGVIYGLLSGKPADWALKCGVAHGALTMTTPGDSSMASLSEVEKLMQGATVRMER